MSVRRLVDLDPREFENCVFDLLRRSGMRNLTWRTPGADGGRDFEGQHLEHDFAGSHALELWYIEAKRYQAAVDWPTVREKLAYAENVEADYLLMVTTSSFSPKCIDEMNRWNDRKRRPRIRGWAKSEIEFRLRAHPDVSLKYGLAEDQTKVAPAFMPLAMNIAKATISASEANGVSHDLYLQYVVALSELLLIRSKDFVNHARIVIHKPLRAEVWYPWVRRNPSDALDGADTAAMRALLTAIRLVSRCETVAASVCENDSIALALEHARHVDVSPARELLDSIVLWGDLDLRILTGLVVVTPRKGVA